MTSTLQAAQAEYTKRQAAKAAKRDALTAEIRQIAADLAAGKQPPAGRMVEICETIEQPPKYFEDAAESCKRWRSDQERAEPLPAMRKKLAELEAQAARLDGETREAFEVQKAAFGKVFNPAPRGEADQYTEHATADQIAEYREASHRWGKLVDQLWLARRDASRLRDEIGELAEIQKRNEDPTAKGPLRFRLPELG